MVRLASLFLAVLPALAAASDVIDLTPKNFDDVVSVRSRDHSIPLDERYTGIPITVGPNDTPEPCTNSQDLPALPGAWEQSSPPSQRRTEPNSMPVQLQGTREEEKVRVDSPGSVDPRLYDPGPGIPEYRHEALEGRDPDSALRIQVSPRRQLMKT